MNGYSRDEMMTVAAARQLRNGQVCFVGIGLPSAACNLARLTHAPELVLIYESGTLGTRPDVLPLSIGDGNLAETAACVIPLPEVFAYLLQAGRVDVGFLGAAQIDRFGNLNSTVIGDYAAPKTRLPGAGGACEIAAHAKATFIMAKATPRSFVAELDFCTSAGFLTGNGERGRSAATGGGPTVVITDFGMLKPLADETLAVAALFDGVAFEQAQAMVGWPLQKHAVVDILAPPSVEELGALRALQERTRIAHQTRIFPKEMPA